MSTEAWSVRGHAQRLVRLHICGHAVKLSELKPSSSLPECPICGEPCTLDKAPAFDCDVVPTPCLTWNEGSLITSHKLQVEVSNGQVTSLEQLVSAVNVHHRRIELPDRKLRKASRPTVDGPGFQVWKSGSWGCQVAGGQIQLVREDMLLLTGKGVHFKDTTFEGGSIICAEGTFSGTFRKCTFLACSLYIVHGACATLADCTWRDNSTKAALIAHGPETTATVTTCTFRDCRFGVIAEAGATVNMHACSMAPVSAGVVANDPGSHISAEDCTIQGARPKSNQIRSCCGLSMHGGSARLYRCHISQFTYATLLCAAASALEVQDSYIEGSPHSCIFEDGAVGSLIDTHIITHPGQAADAVNAPEVAAVSLVRESERAGVACLQMTRCEVHSQEQRAVSVSYGSRAALHLCRIDRCRTGVVSVDRGSYAVVSHCSAEAKDACCIARGASVRVKGGEMMCELSACLSIAEGHLVLSNAHLRGYAGTARAPMRRQAVVMVMAASAVLHACRVSDSVTAMHAESSRVRVKDTHVADMVPALRRGGRGEDFVSQAFHCAGSDVSVEGGSVRDCVMGATVLKGESGTPGSLRLCGVSLSQYSRGLDVNAGCAADVVGCGFWGHAGMSAANCAARDREEALQRASVEGSVHVNCALMFAGAQRGSVSDCVFNGNDLDVLAGSEEKLCIQNCTFQHSGGIGTAVKVNARADVEACEFQSGHGGIGAAGPDAVATVRGCAFSEGLTLGAMAFACGRLVASDCSFRAKEMGLAVGMQGEAAAQDCVFEGCEVGMTTWEGGGTLSGTRLTFDATTAVAVRAQRDPDESIAPMPGAPADLLARCVDGAATMDHAVRLESCAISAAQAGVVVSGQGVTATLVDCQLSGSDVGVVSLSGAAAAVRRTSVISCVRGVTAGYDADSCGVDFAAYIGSQEPLSDDGGCVCPHCGAEVEACRVHAASGPDDAHADEPADVSELAAKPHACAEVALEDVEVRDCSEYGVQIGRGGAVQAESLRMSGCAAGFSVVSTEFAERFRVARCSVDVPEGGTLVRVLRGGPDGMDAAEEDVALTAILKGVEVVDCQVER